MSDDHTTPPPPQQIPPRPSRPRAPRTPGTGGGAVGAQPRRAVRRSRPRRRRGHRTPVGTRTGRRGVRRRGRAMGGAHEPGRGRPGRGRAGRRERAAGPCPSGPPRQRPRGAAADRRLPPAAGDPCARPRRPRRTRARRRRGPGRGAPRPRPRGDRPDRLSSRQGRDATGLPSSAAIRRASASRCRAKATSRPSPRSGRGTRATSCSRGTACQSRPPSGSSQRAVRSSTTSAICARSSSPGVVAHRVSRSRCRGPGCTPPHSRTTIRPSSSSRTALAARKSPWPTSETGSCRAAARTVRSSVIRRPLRTSRLAWLTEARARSTAPTGGGSHGSPAGAGSGAMRTAAPIASSVHAGPPAGPGCTRRESSQRLSSAAAVTSGTPIPRSSAHLRPRSSARIRSRPLSVTARSTIRSVRTPCTTPSRAPRSVTPARGCSTPSSASSADTRARAPPPAAELPGSLIRGIVATRAGGAARPRGGARPGRRAGTGGCADRRPAMLGPMDIPAAGAGPWIVLGVVLGIGLVALAALATTRLRRPAPTAAPEPSEPPEPSGFGDDDLPGFLESPPGSAASEPGAPGEAWTSLAPAPVPPATPRPAAPLPAPDHATVRTLAVLAAVTLLLVGAAATVAIASRSSAAGGGAGPQAGGKTGRTPPSSASATAEPDPRTAGALAGTELRVGSGGVAAELAFGGVILERRAVGVTATYPVLPLTASGGRGRALAHVQLPTWNCLADAAPDDPVAAGCTRSVTEYADLATPRLSVARNGDLWRIGGRLSAYVPPQRSPPAGGRA